MKTIKVGIVGCGGIGKHHSGYLQKIPNVEIAAAADIDAGVLKSYREKFSVEKVYADYTEMLSSGKLDAALICLPTFLHCDPAVKAAANGIAVFCEKPLARTLSQAEQITSECKENGILLQVGFVRRFDNCWLKAKKVAESGVLGKPIVWRQVATSSGPGRISWFLEKEKGGGPILDGMVHNFDFGNFMFGKAVKVVSGLTRFRKSSAMDTGSVWVEYESGNVMSNFWSWGMPEKVSCFSGMDMIGPDAALEFPGGFDASEFSSHFDSEKEDMLLLKKSGGATEPVVYQKNDFFLDQMKYFADCVRQNRQPKVTGKDGLRALRVALAALQEEQLP